MERAWIAVIEQGSYKIGGSIVKSRSTYSPYSPHGNLYSFQKNVIKFTQNLYLCQHVGAALSYEDFDIAKMFRFIICFHLVSSLN